VVAIGHQLTSNPEPGMRSKTAVARLDLGSARILLADRDVLGRRLIEAVLEERGYAVVSVPDGVAAFQALEEHAVDVVILDVTRDGYDGFNTLQQIRHDRRYADLPVLLLTNPMASNHAEAGLESGADDLITKPVEPRVLLARVRSSLRTRRALLGMEAAHAVVAALANEINSRDTDIRLHTERLGLYASELGRRVGLSATDLNAIAYGTLLHDLGKIGISESIRLKPGPLTPEEREVMKRHTEIGERIAASLAGSERFGPIIRHHHERWDGQGYPDGLRAEAIPMGARIISVVDAFDAMTQYRPYRSPRSVPEAIEELRRERGRQFDPRLVDTFIQVLEWDSVI